MTSVSAATFNVPAQVARDAWLAQFTLEDRHDALRLLAAVRDVTADEFRDALTGLLSARIAAVPGHVALFVESERGHRHGRAHRLFKESENTPRRAGGSAGPPVVQPLRTVDPEVGSEGLVANIVSQVHRQHRKRTTIRPLRAELVVRERHEGALSRGGGVLRHRGRSRESGGAPDPSERPPSRGLPDGRWVVRRAGGSGTRGVSLRQVRS